MNAIRPIYFSYPKTEENKANFQDWICPICRSDDTKEIVAHGSIIKDKVHIDGRKHPIHLYCLLSWLERSAECPTCKYKADASAIIPLATKCRITALRAYNSLPSIYERCRNWVANPMHQVPIGVVLMLVGFAKKTASLTAAGMILQANGIQDAIQCGSRHIAVAIEMKKLAEDILSDLQKGNIVQGKLKQLKSLARSYEPYYSQIADWIESSERGKIYAGLDETVDLLNIVLMSDRMLRMWRNCMALGSLYYGGKALLCGRCEEGARGRPHFPRELFFQVLARGLSAWN
jgi:hypothetical protein